MSAVHPPTAAEHDESTGSVLAALAANTAIAIAKGTAAALTGSPALFAETLHTVADTGNEVLLYVAVTRSARAPDASHPLGYGSERWFWALLAAIGMFVIGGAVSIWEGIQAILDPPELEAFWVGVGVLLVALLLDGTSRLVATRQLRRQAARRGVSVRQLLGESADPTVVTVYFEDTIDVLGAALALLALILHRVTGSGVPDAIVTLVIGLLLAYTAYRLTKRNRGLLSGEAVPERYVAWLREQLEAAPEVHAVHGIEAVYLGAADVQAAVGLAMRPGMDGEEVAQALARLRAEIKGEVPALRRLYLTPVPARPQHERG